MELEARDELDEEAEDELEESFALSEPQALKAKMPATARDTHAVAFLVVTAHMYCQEFSRFCKYFYHKMHYTRVLHIKEIELPYITKLNFIYERIN